MNCHNLIIKGLGFSMVFLVAILFSKTACAQVIDAPKEPKLITGLMNGRIIGVNLQNIKGATVTNKRTNLKDTSNSLGFYKLEVAVTDTLFFEYPGLSREIREVKNFKNKLNVILIRRKMDSLPGSASSSDLSKAKKADNELYKILEKDAKLEGKWDY